MASFARLRLVELLRRPGGRTLALVPPDDALLLGERRAVPDLDVHPDPAGDQVAAALEPGGADAGRHPDVVAQQVGVLGLDVAGAVLEAEQVARRGLARRRRRRAAEPELRPPHGRGAEPHPDQVADGVHGDLRVVGARLDAQVAAGQRRVDLVELERRQRREPGGPLRAEARACRRSQGPTPNVSVSDDAGSPSASPVSVGGASGLRLTAPPGVASAPAVMRSAARVQRCSRSLTAARSVVVRSIAAKCSRSWAGVTIPAWYCPRNGMTPSGGGGGLRVR